MKLVLLDRDGVINEDTPQGVLHPDQLHLIAGSADAIARLNQSGIGVAVVTNQSAVGKGLIDADRLADIHTRLNEQLAHASARLDAIYYCGDHPDHPTAFRKPGPAMLLQAMADYGAAPSETMMIGDALRDLEAAFHAGCGRILVETGKGKQTQQAADWILQTQRLAPVAIYANLWDAVDHNLPKWRNLA